MSQKKSKEARQKEKVLEQAQKEGEEIMFTINVNVHKNGSISVEPLPTNPLIVVDILTHATKIATQFAIQKMVEEIKSGSGIEVIPAGAMPPGRLH